jgi:hypothetical protein
VSKLTPPRPGPCIGHAPQPPLPNPKFATFSYHSTTKTNAMKFMHQILCNPPILLLIKAINAGFLKGAPHLSVKTVIRYSSPSLATATGHVKRPHKGLQSMTPKQTQPTQPVLPRPPPAQIIHEKLMPGLIPDNEDSKDQPALITEVEDESITNIFFSEHLPTRTPASCITTALVTSPSCPWTAMSVFCYVSLQNQCHLCHTYTWTRFEEHFWMHT